MAMFSVHNQMIISGKLADGSDAKQIEGMYESPCGLYWSNQPFTRKQKAYSKVWHHCERYRKTFRQLYHQVKAGSKENLPKWVRDWLINKFENEL